MGERLPGTPEPMSAEDAEACLKLAQEHLAAWHDRQSVAMNQMSLHDDRLEDDRRICVLMAVGPGVPLMRNVIRVLRAKGVLKLDPRYEAELDDPTLP